MKNLLLILEIVIISILVTANNKTVTVYADWKEAESRPASTASVEYNTVHTEGSQEVKVTVCVPSVYVVSIPKETKEEFIMNVKGDIASDERLHIEVENISTYLYWNSLPTVINGKKVSNNKVLNYKINLERRF